MILRREIVRLLNSACAAVDEILYRPAIVKLTLPLPRWWNCGLAKLSMRLDERWGTGFWDPPDAPPAPNGRCEACERRAAWLVVGGPLEDEGDRGMPSASYLDRRPINVCGWCHVRFDRPPRDNHELKLALDAARKRSISWSWRWRPR